jgi:hypothetical protein
VTDAAPAPTPPLAPEAAKAEIARLVGGADPAFTTLYANGDLASRERMGSLHKWAYEAPAATPSAAAAASPVIAPAITEAAAAKAAARAEIDRLTKGGDLDFIKAYAEGDVAARAKMDELQRVANADVDPEAAAAEAAASDAAFAPGKPEEFKLPSLAGPGEEHSPDEMVAHAETARGWLAAAELPASIGSALAEEVAQINTMYSGLDDGGVQLHAAGERAKLDRLWGDDAPRKIALARQLVRELETKKPGIVDLLSRTGAGNSSVVIAQLALHAERLLARGPRGS